MLVVVGIIAAIVVPTYFSSRNYAQRRTCQANLRTIDGAIFAYDAQYEAFPPDGKVGDILVPEWIRNTPTCPTTGKEYVLRVGPDGQTTTSCPTNEPGHNLGGTGI